MLLVRINALFDDSDLRKRRGESLRYNLEETVAFLNANRIMDAAGTLVWKILETTAGDSFQGTLMLKHSPATRDISYPICMLIV
jgi:hypothetical protein